MREIKFRCWDYDRKKMYVVDELSFGRRAAVHVRSGDFLRILFLDKIELMQYTGVKDKCGNEIYESDILELYQSPIFGNSAIGEVFWDNCVSSPYIGFGLWIKTFTNKEYLPAGKELFNCKVIGNKFESQELLNEHT